MVDGRQRGEILDLKYKNASATAGMKWTTVRGDLVTADISWNKHAYYHAFTSTTLAEGFDEKGNFILDYPYFAGQKLLMSNQERTMLNSKERIDLHLHPELEQELQQRQRHVGSNYGRVVLRSVVLGHESRRDVDVHLRLSYLRALLQSVEDRDAQRETDAV